MSKYLQFYPAPTSEEQRKSLIEKRIKAYNIGMILIYAGFDFISSELIGANTKQDFRRDFNHWRATNEKFLAPIRKHLIDNEEKEDTFCEYQETFQKVVEAIYNKELELEQKNIEKT